MCVGLAVACAVFLAGRVEPNKFRVHDGKIYNVQTNLEVSFTIHILVIDVMS